MKLLLDQVCCKLFLYGLLYCVHLCVRFSGMCEPICFSSAVVRFMHTNLFGVWCVMSVFILRDLSEYACVVEPLGQVVRAPDLKSGGP